ncbi:MAG: hypothetical protein LBD94_00815 [Rickettsiales bacterium]|jgi:hypothetical protein|nr:hypothetical protein [Rickettsiales bacterium]
MPLKKKNKLRNRIIFWTIFAIVIVLMIYVPKKPSGGNIDNLVEYELY